jgi:hypothetical protein
MVYIILYHCWYTFLFNNIKDIKQYKYFYNACKSIFGQKGIYAGGPVFWLQIIDLKFNSFVSLILIDLILFMHIKFKAKCIKYKIKLCFLFLYFI